LLSVSLTLAQKPTTPHTLLWRISGKKITHPSYLFGTMHVLCAKDAALSDSLKAAIRTCDEIYFEINLGDMMGMLNSMKFMRMNGDKTLADLLKPDEYARVKGYFEKNVPFPPFSMLERFKPMLISGIVEEQAMDCETKDGMEMQILGESKTYNKPVDGLETAEFQATLFDSIPYTDQAKELVNSIDSADQNKQQTQQLVELYNRQDLDGIDSLSRKDDGGVESNYMDLLLYARNRKWARLLDGLLPQKSLLIAVGAAHLPGKGGVIDLLRKEGYKVEPVQNQVSNGQVATTIRPTH
jgi:uncharacterized protein YbaP (TraB family)